MPSDEIPDDLRDFIAQYIDSIAHIEALLLLRDSPGQDWTIEKVASRLYITEAESIRVLSDLERNGFFARSDDHYRFACRSPELEELSRRMAQLYRQKLIPVTNLIHSKEKRVQQFADAFRLRKES